MYSWNSSDENVPKIFKYSNLIVFGFEPNSYNVNVLKGTENINSPFSKSSQYEKNNIQKYIDTRFFIIPFALSNYTGHATFYNIENKINNQTKKFDYDSGSSSLLEPIEMDYHKSETKVFKLEDFLSQKKKKKIPFINQVKISRFKLITIRSH